MIESTVIADSINPYDIRLTTLQVTFPRFVLAEFNTHRKFSRNSASSRAIPVKKQIEAVLNNPVMPIEFGSNQPGMQAGPPLVGDELLEAQASWLEASRRAVESAESLLSLNVHKQVVNRVLEPFLWHTVIVTASDWVGFFDQRISVLAQPEIRVAAEAMKASMDLSMPIRCEFGRDWHLPYLRDDEHFDLDTAKKVSTARCARVSYLTQEGVRDYLEDLKLFDRLVSAKPIHASPAEHIATPDCRATVLGNFDGWRQFRHDLFY